jgi:glycosyltransferase involved in cell wall biosynthesis
MPTLPTEESRDAESAAAAPTVAGAPLEPAQILSTAERTRRVLLVSLDFPPRRTSGVYRPTGLAKYLGRFGWNPTVLTTGASSVSLWDAKHEDETLLRRLPPSVRVERTPFFSVSGWEKKASALAGGQSKKANSGAKKNDDAGASQPTGTPAPASGPSALHRITSWAANLVRTFLYFPDDTVGWLPYAVSRAIRLHEQEKFDAIYTTSPPRSTQLIGLWLKLLLGVPWVVEFRDPWYAPPSENEIWDHRVPRFRRWLEARINSMLLRNADAIVVMTDGHARELCQHFGVPQEKVHVVPNGFDEEDFCGPHAAKPSAFAEGYIHISHFGTVYPKFSGKFFAALAGLLRESPELKDVLRVNVIGFPDDETQRWAQSEELRGVIQFHKLMEHAEAVDAMRASNFLLLFYAHRRIAQVSAPGKLYEYLRVGRPVLAVTYEGGVQRHVEGAQAGFVLPPDDPQAIQRMLREIIHDHWSDVPRGPEPPSPEYVAQFHYESLAAKLAHAMDEAIRVQ